MKNTKNNEEKNAKSGFNLYKFIKKVIFTRKKVKKQQKIKVKNNEKRINKCNKKLLSKKIKDKEIYLKINELNTNGKKTIVYFIDSYYPIIDGVVSVLDNYATFMSNYFNVVVCCPKHKNKTFVSDKYFVLSSNSFFLKKQGYDYALPQLDSKFNKYISMLNIDLIHINAPFNMGMFGLDLAKKRKIPSITTFHSQFKQDFYKSTKNELLSTILSSIIINIYQKSTVTITMNDYAAQIMKDYGLKRKKVEIIPNATNLVYKEFDKNQENNTIEKYRINKNKFNLLFIGRFVKVKNVYFILNILKQLKDNNIPFNMIFLGYGPEESKMKNFCSENNLIKDVVFTGKVLDEDEKSIIIKNSNLLLFPSTYDTDGITKIECACYGVPTLCLENTGVAAGLIDNENAFIEKNDLSCFVERLKSLIKNPEYVKQVGLNAQKQIYITWDEVGKKLMEIYNKLLNTKNLKSAKKNKKKTTKKR